MLWTHGKHSTRKESIDQVGQRGLSLPCLRNDLWDIEECQWKRLIGDTLVMQSHLGSPDSRREGDLASLAIYKFEQLQCDRHTDMVGVVEVKVEVERVCFAITAPFFFVQSCRRKEEEKGGLGV